MAVDYDVVIIGGSRAGRYAAVAATQLGATVALVEPAEEGRGDKDIRGQEEKSSTGSIPLLVSTSPLLLPNPYSPLIAPHALTQLEKLPSK